MRSFSTVFFLIIFTLYTAIAWGQQSDAVKIKEFVSKFESDDSLARQIAFEEFDKEIPPNERPAFLSDMWDSVKDSPKRTDVQLTILAYLVGKDQEQMPWNNRLRDKVIAAGKNNNAVTRQVALNVMIKRNTPDLRAQIPSFLKDENESIRELAIIEISHWADARPRLESYIRANINRPGRAKSVNTARFHLNKQRPVRERQ